MGLSKFLLISGGASVIACIGFAIKNYFSQRKKEKLIRDFYEPNLKFFIQTVKKIICFENDLMSLKFEIYKEEWMHKAAFNELKDEYNMGLPFFYIKNMKDVIRVFAFYYIALDHCPNRDFDECSNYQSARDVFKVADCWVKRFSKKEKKLFNQCKSELSRLWLKKKWTLSTGSWGWHIDKEIEKDWIEMIEKRKKNNEN